MKSIAMWKRCALVLFCALATFGYAQPFSVVYNFGQLSTDALSPQYTGIVAQGRDGNFYSTTPFGGDFDYGAIFTITPSGESKVLYSFNITDGQYPYSGLTLGTDGNFYGTTWQGGSDFSGGVIFKVTPNGKLTVLHAFGYTDGYRPLAPPVQGADGNFYGTTSVGGNGGGTVYRITPSGQFKVIYAFDFPNGAYPYAPLTLGIDGNFYGTTFEGGANGIGTVFRITPQGKITTLHHMKYEEGMYPYAPLVQANDGTLYGTTEQGGTNNFGTIYKVSLNGALTVLHSLAESDGKYPMGGMVQGTDGAFYGSTSTDNGTLFRVTSRGNFAVVQNFRDDRGIHPEVTIMQHTTGILYGDTANGGAFGHGTFFGVNRNMPGYAALVIPTAKVSKPVGVLGQGLIGTTAVRFNGRPAPFDVVSDTFLTVTVPDLATTGLITVETPSGNLKSKVNFRVIPQVQTFSPASGPVGTTVVISGISLSQTTRVSFGGVQATDIHVDQDKQLSVTVPDGAKTGRIVVTTAGGTASSSSDFTVTE
jgi:uncharacterized repeat protein (TIGR03803 family)